MLVSFGSLLGRLSELGFQVGARLLDLLVLRERGYKRETKSLQMLLFLKTTVWKVGEQGL